MQHLITGLIGMIFGTGITIGGMINPAKVLNLFDIAGDWDPSLAFVMGAALLVTSLGDRLVWRRPTPPLAEAFQLPSRKDIDLPLIGGAALFGIGRGIAGFCPSGAIPALGLIEVQAYAFVAALLCGIFLAETLRCGWA